MWALKWRNGTTTALLTPQRFLLFGLIPSLPPLHYSALFPGTRHMYTTHLQATQNGIMLLVVAMLAPWLQLSQRSTKIMEIGMHFGAWFNVIPWVYGGVTGAVLTFGKGQVGGNKDGDPPADNEKHAKRIQAMLAICTIGDLTGWGMVLYGLAKRLRGQK